MHRLFDTHTHFDVPDFDPDRVELAYRAKERGVEALVLIGFVASRFDDLCRVHDQINQLDQAPQSYLAPGLHPFYIKEHTDTDLHRLEQLLKQRPCVAVGEIGLDTFLSEHKQPEIFTQQRAYFSAQLDLATQYDKPVLLHIRKAHADVIQLLKQHKFKHGGIAHAFSGGVEEAKALIKLGFKLGVTGQITNPNAKKLHQVVQAVGAEHLVLETDCPDMTPLCCQQPNQTRTRNTPVNLPYVLEGLATSLGLSVDELAPVMWQNALNALRLNQ